MTQMIIDIVKAALEVRVVDSATMPARITRADGMVVEIKAVKVVGGAMYIIEQD